MVNLAAVQSRSQSLGYPYPAELGADQKDRSLWERDWQQCCLCHFRLTLLMRMSVCKPSSGANFLLRIICMINLMTASLRTVEF